MIYEQSRYENCHVLICNQFSLGDKSYIHVATYYQSEWSCICVVGVSVFNFFYDFSIGIRNFPESVFFFFFFHCITSYGTIQHINLIFFLIQQISSSSWPQQYNILMLSIMSVFLFSLQFLSVFCCLFYLHRSSI